LHAILGIGAVAEHPVRHRVQAPGVLLGQLLEGSLVHDRTGIRPGRPKGWNNARLAAGRATIWGWAWAGEGELTGIDISTDGGQTWTPGRFTGTWDRYSWRKFEHDWDARPGAHTLMARATDSLGHVQPTSRSFNRLGYRWNVIHAVKADVA
jgi:hypothetical protein